MAASDTYEYNSDDEENDDNWPMWSRVWDPQTHEYYYYNNFDGSQVGECPEDYVLPDIVHEQAAPPSHAEWVRRGHIRRGSSSLSCTMTVLG